MSVLLLPLTSLGSLDNSARPHVLFHAVDIEKKYVYVCLHVSMEARRQHQISHKFDRLDDQKVSRISLCLRFLLP